MTVYQPYGINIARVTYTGNKYMKNVFLYGFY